MLSELEKRCETSLATLLRNGAEGFEHPSPDLPFPPVLWGRSKSRHEEIERPVVTNRSDSLDDGYLQITGAETLKLFGLEESFLERLQETPVSYRSQGIRRKFAPLDVILLYSRWRPSGETASPYCDGLSTPLTFVNGPFGNR